MAVADRADRLPLDPDQIAALTAVTSRGGLVVFPAETVYGLATDPDDADAVRRMAELKRRDPAKPSSVLFWSLDDALAVLDGAPAPVLRAVSRLLPGPIGLIVPNPQRRFGPACGDDPTTLGIRVPLLDERVAAAVPCGGAPAAGGPIVAAPTGGPPVLASPVLGSPPGGSPTAGPPDLGSPPDGPPAAGPLTAGGPQARRTGSQPSWPPIVQTSANLAGGPDPTTLAAVPAEVRAGADLLLDAGERPGTPSTIVDLRGITDATPDGWRLVRKGPITAAAIVAALSDD